ncbi:HNH endonuclease [Niallia sp. XMNu-256]|uniref:HNH endonuclease n=1 Tax=Niallia sp. XMNu-256 TaxID=3082444 RepID=UPI0030CB2695
MLTIQIKLGKVFNNEDITKVFGCAPQGGMRRSHKTNTLVLVSDHTKALYEDRWEGPILLYTGMGREGDQTLTSQNLTLAQSNSNGVEVHLFEVFEPQKYVYMGIVELAGEPYQERQLDTLGQNRQVWVFSLQVKGKKQNVAIPEKWIKSKQELRKKKAKKLNDEELAARAKTIVHHHVKRKITSITYERDPFVTEFAKRWANGVCQLCEKTAPFLNKNREPHLHTHHIKWLSRGGEDSIANTIALCPNCHDKMHVVDDPIDVEKLKKKVHQHINEDKEGGHF